MYSVVDAEWCEVAGLHCGSSSLALSHTGCVTDTADMCSASSRDPLLLAVNFTVNSKCMPVVHGSEKKFEGCEMYVEV
jgi:hypothetical protein